MVSSFKSTAPKNAASAIHEAVRKSGFGLTNPAPRTAKHPNSNPQSAADWINQRRKSTLDFPNGYVTLRPYEMPVVFASSPPEARESTRNSLFASRNARGSYCVLRLRALLLS